MANQSAFRLLLSIVFLAHSMTAVSVCDEVDVVFVIDSGSVIHNEANILSLIDSIIVNGSSEFAGFSAVSYGHHLPLSAEPVLFHLDDTKHVAHRRETQRVVHEALEHSFQSIKAAVHSGSGHTVTALEAVHHGQSEHSPPSKRRKHELLGEAADYTMGLHDDDTIFIVFDWNNQLLSTPTICRLYQTAPDHHHFYFLFGQHLDESVAVQCGHHGGANPMGRHSFHHFDEREFVEDSKEMMNIFHLTCPAVIHSATYHGHIGLHRKSQFIDPETIVQCDLVHLNGRTEPSRLDPVRSHITAKDYMGDGNTFKAGDHLIADPVAFDRIGSKGCAHPVYKITKVMRSNERHFDVLRGEHYHVLRLYVVLPSSPMDYMSSADVSGDNIYVPLDGGVSTHRRGLQSGDLSYEINKECPSFKDPEDVSYEISEKGVKAKRTEGELNQITAELNQKGLKYEVKNQELMESVHWCREREWKASSVSLQLNYYLTMSIHANFNFKWYWSQIPTSLKVSIDADWSALAHSQVDINAAWTSEDTVILEFKKLFIVPIGPVPVPMEPYLRLSAKLRMKPVHITGTVTSLYQESWKVGVEHSSRLVNEIDPDQERIHRDQIWNSESIDEKQMSGVNVAEQCKAHCFGLRKIAKEKNKNKKEGDPKQPVPDRFTVVGQKCICFMRSTSWWYATGTRTSSQQGAISYEFKREKVDEKIHERTNTETRCEQHLSIQQENDKGIMAEATCPLKVGFDVILTPEVGVYLFLLANAYLEAPITFQFYAKLGDPKDVCSANYQNAKTSFWYQIDIQPAIGAQIEFQRMFNAIKRLISNEEISKKIEKKGISTKLPGVEIQKPTQFGTLQLPSKVNGALHGMCCK